MEESIKPDNKSQSNFADNKNIKPFLSVFIILLIILSGYYFVWRNITMKMKNIVENSLKNYKYDSISISGFPFSKEVKINNINFSNNLFLMTKNQVNIKEITISSFVFSGTLNISFKDATTIDTINNNTIYLLNYNEEPKINLSFYSNGEIKKFYYSDIGYRVISKDNKTLYTAEKSLIDVQSVKDKNTVDYSIVGDFKNIQNISLIENDEQISETIIPSLYSMKFDISTSITKKDKEIESSIIKINDFSLNGDNGNNFVLTGKIDKETDDMYSFGELKIMFSNYKEILSNYKINVIKALQIESENDLLSNEEKNSYIKIADKFFNILNTTILKNPETKNNNAVIVLSRAKNTSDYTINGESLFGIIQQIVAEPKK